MIRPVVCAGIVTCDPDVERLGENIAALYPQVDGLIVFDNASKNIAHIEKLLEGFAKIALIKSPVNAGMAKALNVLCQQAAETPPCGIGAAHLLAMDQDSVADPRMVEKLLEHVDDEVGIVAPFIQNRGIPDASFAAVQQDAHDVVRAITSGSLVNLKAHRSVGGHDERMFVDWVDIEFCLRLREAGYRIVVVPGARLLHDLGRSELLFHIPWLCGGKLVKRPLCRTNHSLERQRDVARSWAILLKGHAGSPLLAGERMHIIAGVVQRLVTEKGKVSLVKALIKGYEDGRACMRGR